MSLKDSSSILETLKESGKSFPILEEKDILGEMYYEEHLFYIPNKDVFCRQKIDWTKFSKYGIMRATEFEVLTNSDALEFVEMATELDKDA